MLQLVCHQQFENVSLPIYIRLSFRISNPKNVYEVWRLIKAIGALYDDNIDIKDNLTSANLDLLHINPSHCQAKAEYAL